MCIISDYRGTFVYPRGRTRLPGRVDEAESFRVVRGGEDPGLVLEKVFPGGIC